MATKKNASAEKDPAAKTKITVASICFVVAALALAWNFGLFESNPTQQDLEKREEAAMTPEQVEKKKKDIKQAREFMEEQQRKPGGVPAGS